MFRFYEEGREKGYIDEDISLRYALPACRYFPRGVQSQNGRTGRLMLTDKQALDELLNLYFFGFVKRK